IRQVASVAQMIPAMLPPGARRPHEVLQIGFNTHLESHLAPAIHPRSGFETASKLRNAPLPAAWPNEGSVTLWLPLALPGVEDELRGARGDSSTVGAAE